MIGVPLVWAQVSGTGANSLGMLALRRWYASLTLSPAGAVPSFVGLLALLAAAALLVGLAAVFQGPSRALRQFFDLPGHVKLAAAAVDRLRRSGRVVAVTIGMTVLSWTGVQIRTYSHAQGRDDLMLLIRSRGLSELALEQGALAALTPLRDVFGLADNLPLLILGTAVLFQVSAARWSEPYVPLSLRTERKSGWLEVIWGCGALYVLYRLVAMASGAGDLPLGGCILLEPLVIPLLMLLLDGALLGWLLVELRTASLGDRDHDALAPPQAIELLPGSALACLAALPARYLATSLLLASYHLPASAAETLVGRYMRWQLYRGLAEVQAAAWAVAGLAGAVAWSRGTLRGALRGYLRLLAAEGGHLAALLTGAAVAAGSLSAVAYLLVLSLPSQTWVLSAADGYAHYATLPVGLLALAALVELGERALPAATLVAENVAADGPAPGDQAELRTEVGDPA